MVVTTGNESLPLRERKRLRAMRRVQREAVHRFIADGFDAVTVEAIAAAAQVSPMSVYRWFGTKESLVIWDEFDPPILAAVADRLARQPPVAAVRDALAGLLDEVYDRERELALDRARLVYAEPALLAAADRNLRLLRGALVDVFAAHGVTGADGRVAAAVVTALLEEAIFAWVEHDGRQPLAETIADTFAAYERLP